MASKFRIPYSLFLTIFIFQLSQISADVTPPQRHGLAIIKDTVKNQYFTTFIIEGDNPSTVALVLDLGNRYTWMACDHIGYKSTSYHAIPCESAKCAPYSGPEAPCLACPGKPSPSCNFQTCEGYAYTYLSKQDPESAGIIEDVIYLYTRPQNSSKVLQYPLPDFPFACSSKTPLEGISENAQGILTLANVDMALHSHISKTFKVPQKFAFCLPNTNTTLQEGFQGGLYIGGPPYYYSTDQDPFFDVSTQLKKTPLVTNPKSTDPIGVEGDNSIEYFINVKSIRIAGKPLKLNTSLLSVDKDGVGGVKFSTLHPYTVLHTSIYKEFVDTFTQLAKTIWKIPRVEAVAPFDACYNATARSDLPSGPNVPDTYIYLEQASSPDKEFRWWIPARSMMVKFADSKYSDVMCLGIVDGGYDAKTSVIIGGMQMEDTFIEIDLESKTIGFVNSPVSFGGRCAQFQSTLPLFGGNQQGSLKSDA